MADPAASKKEPKIVDVAKPARPAVIKRAMMTQVPPDPDAAGDAATIPKNKPVTPETSASVASKVKIEPISKPEDLKPDDVKATETQSTEEVGQDAEADNDSSTDQDKVKDVSLDEQQLIDSKAAERQANYDKLVLAKTYYLPINQVVRRRSKRVAIAGAVLILLLSMAWADVSLDAGIINIPGIEAPTHFF